MFYMLYYNVLYMLHYMFCEIVLHTGYTYFYMIVTCIFTCHITYRLHIMLHVYYMSLHDITCFRFDYITITCFFKK